MCASFAIQIRNCFRNEKGYWVPTAVANHVFQSFVASKRTDSAPLCFGHQATSHHKKTMARPCNQVGQELPDKYGRNCWNFLDFNKKVCGFNPNFGSPSQAANHDHEWASSQSANVYAPQLLSSKYSKLKNLDPDKCWPNSSLPATWVHQIFFLMGRADSMSESVHCNNQRFQHVFCQPQSIVLTECIQHH